MNETGFTKVVHTLLICRALYELVHLIMERFNFGYSIKNIPIPSERNYKLQLMEKIELVIKKMRWKALFSSKDSREHNENEEQKQYGLKSPYCPPVIKELSAFEKDLCDLMINVKFRRIKCSFQNKLNNDIKNISATNQVYTPADKTSNIYKITKEQYSHLLNNAVTSTYKKSNKNVALQVNEQGKKYAKDKGILNKMEVNGTSECFITLKDHKEIFVNNPKTRLLNPAKNEMGRISKDILDSINNELRNILQINQWHNTTDVINWFKNIENKSQYKFVVFDVKEFYPSIKQTLLMKALEFAKLHVDIKAIDYDTILHARKSLLYCNDTPWMKKESGLFDVTMGAYDGAEVCEIVGIYLLYLLSSKCSKQNIGLYRDDGLAVFKNLSGPQSERIKKLFQKIFSDNDLQIEIKCNQKIVDYLDVTLNLNNGSYKPYRKPNDELSYINAKSNHPPNIIKQLPISVESRLRELSSSKEIFEEAAVQYQEALNKCGYSYKLSYETPVNENKITNKKSRKRNIIWFNPPFSKSVCTNVAKYFLELINKHFPINHKYRKIFNRNNLKVSYSCMRNMKTIVNTHNKKTLNENNEAIKKRCNCQRKTTCPLKGECLSENTLYAGTISSNLPNYSRKEYAGISAPPWKFRSSNHKLSFNKREYAKCEIAKEVWKIKDQGGDFNIEWRIIGHAPAYNPVVKKCNLCIAEKVYIAENMENDLINLINKRGELISQCMHRKKYALSHLKARE